MKEELRRCRIDQLKNEFQRYLAEFTLNCPFSTFQRDSHKSTIERRRALGSAVAAIRDEFFLEDLRTTLKVWGIGIRGATLVDINKFAESLSRFKSVIAELDGHNIEDDNLNLNWVIQKLWGVIDGLDIAVNLKGKKVSARDIVKSCV